MKREAEIEAEDVLTVIGNAGTIRFDGFIGAGSNDDDPLAVRINIALRLISCAVKSA